MKKRTVKKLYAMYEVRGNSLEHIKEKHNVKKYSSRVAICIDYYDSLSEWLMDLAFNEYKYEFGVNLYREDGVLIYDSSYKYTAFASDEFTLKMNKLSEIIKYFVSEIDAYYYEIEEDNIFKTVELTGHMYKLSPYETSSSCGNCDGANCDHCKKVYMVYDYVTDNTYYRGYDHEEAERVFHKYRKDYREIIEDILNNYEGAEEVVKDLAQPISVYDLLNTLHIPYVNVYN